jgi:hypothetical protein
MPTPPNRRPGVDASIVQATTVRGYDAPAGAIPPQVAQDLVIASGQDQTSLAVSDILLWNRTNSTQQPIFVMRPGADLTTAPNFPVFAGTLATPNGVVTAVAGSLYVSNSPPSFWQNQDGGTTWAAISDVLGGENLAETLAIGNFTGGNAIVVSNGDRVVGQSNAVAAGFALRLEGGAATGPAGNGGDVLVLGGTSVAGASGSVQVQTQTPTGTNSSGNLSFTTAASATGGGSGGINISTGNTGTFNVPGTPGWITAFGGAALSTGSVQRGGSMRFEAGNALTAGEGGFIRIVAGNSSNGSVAPIFNAPIGGQGGSVLIAAGVSGQAQPGGGVSIRGGTGGPAGAIGGNITLTPGIGGGGFANGEIIGNGVLRSSNIQRGTGDPNILALTGNEGDVYQRTDSGLGQLWLNTNGSTTGWVQLAFAGDFIDSFEQLNWGYLSRVGSNAGGNPEDEYSDLGIFEGLRPSTAGGGTVTASGSTQGGPYVLFRTDTNGDRAAVDMTTGTSTLPHALDHRFIATFRFRNTNVNDQRLFLGFSTLTAASQLASSLPGGGSYFGFLCDSVVGGNWRVISSNGIGVAGPFDTGISPISTSTGTDPYFFVIDATDGPTGIIRFFILDPSLNLISTVTAVASIPSASTVMGLVIGAQKVGGGAGQQRNLQLVSASIVNDASLVGQGGGTGIGSLSLSQVLINGNQTGLNPILINQGSFIAGVTDDNVGNGADLTLISGATTLVGNNTGSVILASAGNAVVASTGDTGDILITSGFLTDVGATGDTGALTLGTGAHAGSGGATGNVIIASGIHSGGVGGTVGDIQIAPGTFTSNSSNPGTVEIRGGSTSLVGVTSGAVTIRSGAQTAASGATGALTLNTFGANLVGNSGPVSITSGSAGTGSGTSGAILIQTGASPAGATGSITLATSNASLGAGGAIQIFGGNSTVGNGSNITVSAGDTVAGGSFGGRIILNPGTGPAGNGVVEVNGKLNVTGLIDPTGLVLDGQASSPATLVAGQGLLWVDNTAVPSRLFFEDDAGNSFDISNGGGGSLATLSDVTLTAPVAGQTLTYNGVDWVNLPGAGGSPLATILGIGNTTGNTAGGIVVSTGDRIAGQTNLVLDPGAALGNRVIIDGLSWPQTDGLSGYVITTDGAGNLSFQAGGGSGGSETFAEAFARMQWGSANARIFGTPFVAVNGIFDSVSGFGSGIGAVSTSDGIVAGYPTLAAVNADAGVQIPTSGVWLDSRFLTVLHFDTTSPPVGMRFFAGCTTGTVFTQVALVAPLERYVGIELVTDAVPAQATFHFVTDDASGVPSLQDTGVSPAASVGFWLTVDASVSGEVTLTLYDREHAELATHTFTSNLPTVTNALGHVLAVRSLDGAIKTVNLWSTGCVTRADLLSAIGGGGGGNQNLTSVLGFGASTGGIAIQGDDNPAGSGSDLELLGGSSTGGAGSGGDVVVQAGSPSAGNGSGGDVLVSTPAGVGTGGGGDITFTLGAGGPTNGEGGTFSLTLGAGVGGGDGGDFLVTAGAGGVGGGDGGVVQLIAGSATGGSGLGGNVDVACGDGTGTADGGSATILAGDGGAGGGDGGDITITAGAGLGGGADGEVLITGDTTITGKLTVTGLIDPTGLLLDSQVAVPFAATGSDGGIWVNNSGELVYTNSLGDLNLSTAIGGGVTFLDALTLAGYGFLSAGNSASFPQSSGVYGGSADMFVSPGPPTASVTFGTDSDGPRLAIATAAAPNSNAWVSTTDAMIRRDQLFRAVFKFQSTSPSHDNERLFVGFTTDPTVQITVDDPPGLEYIGIRQNHSPTPAHNLEFVARGSGGAIVATLAIPTDVLVHYLVVDAISATQVVLTILAADGVTIDATLTIPQSLLLPSLTTDLYPFTGIWSSTGATPRGIDFYQSSVVTRADLVDAVTGGGSGGGGAVPPLSNVLNAGNSTGAFDIEISDAAPSGIVTEAAAPNTTATGKDLRVAMGAGSAQTGTGLAGTSGGDFRVLCGVGGTSDAIAQPGGAGGLVIFTAGNGAVNSGGAAGGVGGTMTFDAGDGGNATAGAGVGGAAGGISILGGSGGSSVGGIGGAGGSLVLTAGAGGASAFGSFGGTVSITGGASAAGPGGGVTLTTGAGTSSGNLTLVGANATNGAGSQINLTSGNAGGGTGGVGGRIRLTAGNGANNAAGGSLEFISGVGNGTGDGGNFAINLGAGGATAGDGGDFNLLCGAGTGGGQGGGISIQAGAGNGAGTGGTIVVQAGTGGATNAVGGDFAMRGGTGGGSGTGGSFEISGGTGGPTAGDGGDCEVSGGAAGAAGGDGGDLVLDGGAGIGPGVDGNIVISGTLDDNGDGFKMGATNGFVGVGPHAIPFGSAFSTTPRVVQISLETGGAATLRIQPTSISTTGFSIIASIALIAGDTIHWTAYR